MDQPLALTKNSMVESARSSTAIMATAPHAVGAAERQQVSSSGFWAHLTFASGTLKPLTFWFRRIVLLWSRAPRPTTATATCPTVRCLTTAAPVCATTTGGWTVSAHTHRQHTRLVQFHWDFWNSFLSFWRETPLFSLSHCSSQHSLWPRDRGTFPPQPWEELQGARASGHQLAVHHRISGRPLCQGAGRDLAADQKQGQPLVDQQQPKLLPRHSHGHSQPLSLCAVLKGRDLPPFPQP